jgi:hypothetical protein
MHAALEPQGSTRADRRHGWQQAGARFPDRTGPRHRAKVGQPAAEIKSITRSGGGKAGDLAWKATRSNMTRQRGDRIARLRIERASSGLFSRSIVWLVIANTPSIEAFHSARSCSKMPSRSFPSERRPA